VTAPIHIPSERRIEARSLDIAKGVLVGLQRCSPDAAFSEIVEVSRTHGFPPMRLAQAIVDTFADPDLGAPDDPAFDIVRLRWGSLLTRPDHTQPDR
jgi:hypothetical protein